MPTGKMATCLYVFMSMLPLPRKPLPGINLCLIIKEKAVKEGRIPWRVSSTLFSHIRYGVTLEPLGKFKTAETAKNYPAIDAKEFSLNELDLIKLKR